MEKLSKRNIASWAIVGLIGIPVSIFYWNFSDPRGATRYFDFDTGYYAAARAVLHGGASALLPLYKTAIFINLPIVAWLLTPLGFFSQHEAEAIFAFFGVTAVVAAILILTGFGRKIATPLIFLLFVVNGPLWYSVLIGNSTHIIFLLLVGGLTFWERRKNFSAGILFAAAAVIKPMLLLVGVYFIWKKNWAAVMGGGMILLLAFFGTLAFAGPSVMAYWYQHAVAPFAGRPMPAFNDQSVASFILRFSKTAADAQNWQPQSLTSSGHLVLNAALLCMLVPIGFVFWRGRNLSMGSAVGRLGEQDYLEFSLVLVLAMVLSTVSWTHYYLILLLPYSLYFTDRLRLKNDRLTRILIPISIILCSLPVHLHVFGSGSAQTIYFRTLQSCWLFGGLLLIWALARGIEPAVPARE